MDEAEALLRDAVRLRRTSVAAERDAVHAARRAGMPWARIAELLELSIGTVHGRYRHLDT